MTAAQAAVAAKTLGQISREARTHRNPDAVPWGLLDPDSRRAEENGAAEVVLAIDPTIVMMRAELDQRNRQLEAVRTELLRGGQGPSSRCNAALRVLCNPDGSLK